MQFNSTSEAKCPRKSEEDYDRAARSSSVASGQCFNQRAANLTAELFPPPHTHTHTSQCICNWKLYWFHSFICKICWRENVQNQPQNWLRYRDDSSVVNTWIKGKVRPEMKILSLSTHSANDGGPQNIYFGASQQNSVSWRADVDKQAKQNDIKRPHEARPHPNHQSSAFKWCYSHHRGAVGLVHPLQASVKILF